MKEAINTSSFLTKNTQPQGPTIVFGEGEVFYDDSGKRYLDFCSQTLNLSLGHGHPAIKDAVKASVEKLTHISSRFGNNYINELARRLVEVAPKGISKVNLKVTSGTLANEGALKIAYKKRNCTGVVSLLHSHHGQSVETMRVSGKHFEKTYLNRNGVFFVEPCCPRQYRFFESENGTEADSANEICDTIRKYAPSLAAVIIEPIMVDAGVIIPPKGYLQRIREETQEHGITLIFDEVQTAFGWTGYMFASEMYGVTPDIITVCKGFAAGLPLGAMLLQDGFDVLDYGEHEITHGANVLACSAALENIKLLTKTPILHQVRSNGAYLLQLLHQVANDYPHLIRDVRGVGFICGVELDDKTDHLAAQVLQDCMNRGLALRNSKVGMQANVLQFKPPLITSRTSIEEAANIFSDVIQGHSKC